MGAEEGVSPVFTTHGITARRSISALLSQVLVAFTIEFDNEFERRMGEAGYPGARLSLVVWANLMRFVAEGAVSVRGLAAQALAPDRRMKFELGCLERWGFVVLQPDPAGRQLRDGWGSGRGIRADWMVRLTPKGLAASEIWPPLFSMIERRWEKRLGEDEIGRLREALQDLAGKLDVELPHGLPGGWEEKEEFPPRVKRGRERLPLPTLLSQLLLTFRLEFDPESRLPLALCANTLRVLGEKPIRVAEIPRLTGGSPETTGIGWQIKPFVVVTPNPAASRGKVVRLSAAGLRAQQAYHRLIGQIEKRWELRFGKEAIGRLCGSLQGLFDRHNEAGPLLSEGLVPPKGTVRAGDRAPALGRRDVGTAAGQRMRDLVAQTEAFVRDPAGTLPHYPPWDMNRGFGP
jgi:DNA-binding MarR family transcriptional regulator